MHFLWIKSLIRRYKNQPLLLSLGGCLEEKYGQISGYNKKLRGKLLNSFRTKF